MPIESVVIIILLIIIILLLVYLRPPKSNDAAIMQARLDNLQSGLKQDFQLNRTEAALLSKENRAELHDTLVDFKEELVKTLALMAQQNQQAMQLSGKTSEDANKTNREALENAFRTFGETIDKNADAFNKLQIEKFSQLEYKQNRMMESNEKKLEEMRVTVDEKLQKTLNERLGQSFEMVGKQLESVQKGLGEMQTLAQDVGGLKRVLSNVKMRGGIGEVQLAMLLEQVLAPEQYAANVKTKQESADLVEFAIKLPGRDEVNSVVWLPVDAKFPKDVYEQLQDAYETGDPTAIENATCTLENVIKKMAKDIRDKYIDPPNTTDFAIMFLPFEGIYAEVVRKASLLDVLQREYKVIVTGPTTLAAILNSLQMGFRTLALQQRSSEVWKILGAVKNEFAKFGDLMGKAQKNLQQASAQIDELMGKRTRAINRKLQDVASMPAGEGDKLLAVPGSSELTDNEEE